MTQEELELLTQEELDEIVYDLKSEEARYINNNGKKAQICYILGIEVPS